MVLVPGIILGPPGGARYEEEEEKGWRPLLFTMSSNNKCWGAVDSLLPFAEKKEPFYDGYAPEYQTWYNNNKTIPLLWDWQFL